MGQSSFGGGSLKRASSRNSAARCLHGFFCALANDSVGCRIAIFDKHTWLACLETDAFPLLIHAAIGAAHWLHSKVVCHVSAVTPRVERKQGVSMLPQDRGVVVVLLAKERRKSREYNRTALLWEREERREAEFRFSADRGFASTTQQQNSNKAWMHYINVC